MTRFSGYVSGVIVLVVRNGFGRRFGDFYFGRALDNVTKSDEEILSCKILARTSARWDDISNVLHSTHPLVSQGEALSGGGPTDPEPVASCAAPFASVAPLPVEVVSGPPALFATLPDGVLPLGR